jgi:Rad3-related DNA helicase
VDALSEEFHSLVRPADRAAAARASDGPAGVTAVRAQRGAGLLPAPALRGLHSATLFSATLAPPAYAIQLLGLPENTAWIDVPPAFAPST